MTGLADEADATFFNPAGLAFQTTAKADVTYANWLPGLYGGKCYASAASGAPVRLPFLRGHNTFIAGSLTYLTVGETDLVNERGDFLGRVNVWRGALAAHAATLLTSKLGVGVGLKLVQSVHARTEDWMWEMGSVTGLEVGGNATTVAADIGLTYQPSALVTLGLAVANLGPRISYRPDYEKPYVVDLPRTVRLGLCWRALESRYVRLRVMPELDKVLVGMFYDTTGTETFGQMLKEELRDVWKAVGVEAVAFNVISVRLGYLEDLTNQRGGLVYEEEGTTYHYGIGDVLAGRHLGRFKSLGLCWGLGFGSDKLRFDFSSDAAIQNFSTPNWKFQLVSNDIGGLIQMLRGN